MQGKERGGEALRMINGGEGDFTTSQEVAAIAENQSWSLHFINDEIMNRDSPTEPSMTSPASPPLGHVFETPLRDLVGIIWGGAFSSSKSTPFDSIHSHAAVEEMKKSL